MRECIECGRSLPLRVYRRTKNNGRWKVCPDCCKAGSETGTPSTHARIFSGENSTRGAGYNVSL
nr:MAG TPA: zinc-ribbon domain protein [Caudoviricetes sp.]